MTPNGRPAVTYNVAMALTAHTLARIFGTPLLVSPRKLEVALAVLGPRLGVDVARVPAMSPDEPEAADKERSPLHVEGGIATVQVIGTLGHRVSAMAASSGASSYETMAAELRAALADPRVEGVLLEVDSFGGEASGVFDLADVIRMVAAVKPVVGVANQFALSAGYALLSQADHVFVPQTGMVGSVGVVTTHMDVTGAMAKEGIKVTHVFAGDRKVDLSPYVSLSPEAKAALEKDVEAIYSLFTITAGRVPGRANAAALRKTEAATFTGKAAVEAGLANAVGDKAAALAFLKATVEDRRMDAELVKQNLALKAELASAVARLQSYEAAEQAALKAADNALLEAVQKDTADAQAPISAEHLALVKAALDRGDRVGAKALADGFVAVAKAKGQAAASASAPLKGEPITPKGKTHAEAIEQGTQRLLEAAMASGILPKAPQ